MTDLRIINQKREGTLPYIAGLHGEKIGIYAVTLIGAKTLAISHFKPKKKDMGLLWVHPAEENT